MPTKRKKPKGWYSAEAKAARKARREKERAVRRHAESMRNAEEARVAKVEAPLVMAKLRATAEAIDTAQRVLEKRSADWHKANERWAAERAAEARAAKLRRREEAQRKRDWIPNSKLNPVGAVTPTGEKVIVDAISGRFSLMMRRSGWPRELAAACIEFERDYSLSALGGIKAQGYDPKVDSSSGEGNLKTVEATMRLRRMEAMMSPDEFAIMCLWAGIGITITVLHERGVGVKDELGRLLRGAAQKAAAFYANRAAYREETERVRRMHDLIKEVSAAF